MGSTDPDDIRDELVSILDRDDLETLSENGRRLVETQFSFDAATDRYREILATFAR
jgi:glycosyltransferase involved in cell wall biosynthesis